MLKKCCQSKRSQEREREEEEIIGRLNLQNMSNYIKCKWAKLALA